ncbi:hypothetical protein H8F24_05775 [Synechococcus sp. CBW1002]|uniref:hypothetical protein n=1 Tax=Synechococcus sp. CBW1002 TaxID=1353134 RepID=UPI0018CF115B|nr:hypothetical protein [Synechococcus sp. CBW1002]QPN60871.1 hypothetical protein H8F24_05830 [Synechococcus sp. CBW1002]QPN61026.1 hypothetical protein H8F24_06875 [Synechococcus sp. CBW1002]QPN61913.1 hypothetical protein H8F24_05775 [Synechococcus sp. CBW1002]
MDKPFEALDQSSTVDTSRLNSGLVQIYNQENGQQPGFMSVSVACFALYDHGKAAAAYRDADRSLQSRMRMPSGYETMNIICTMTSAQHN